MAVQTTIAVYPLDGTNRKFVVPYEYLTRRFVTVTLLGTDRKPLVLGTDFRFITANQIETTQAWGVAQGYDNIEVRRETSATQRLVDFYDGSVLRSRDLNVSAIQTIHIAEEARNLAADTLASDDDGNLDARGRRLVNLGNAVNPKDAMTLDQVTGWSQSALNQANRSQTEANKSAASAATALVSQNAALVSQNAAKTSETNAKASEIAAKTSETNAKTSENAALVSQNATKTSETNAKASELAAEGFAAEAEQSAQAAAQSASQSDVVALRQDLANPDKGAAAMVGRGMVAVDSIADLLTLDPMSDKEYVVKGFHQPQNNPENRYSGGNSFYWDSTRSKSSHNGGRVIDPNKSFPEDWSDPLQVAEWFEPPIDGAGVFVAIVKRATPDITVEEYGAMAGTDLDHAPVFAAIYRGSTNRSTVIFSRGVYKTSAPFTVRIGSSVEGVSRTDTTIEGLGEGVTCIRLENAGTGRTMNCRVTNIGVKNPLTFTGITADFRGASYCRFEGVQVTISGGAFGSNGQPTAWADAIGIDLSRGGASFNGYISLTDCYVDYHRIGLQAHINDCRIEGGFFNKNGQLGIDIQGGAVYSIQAAEVSGNGTETDPDNHGGVRFAGTGLFCSGVWNEYNVRMFPRVYSPNNWITKNGTDVFIIPGRDDQNKSSYPASGFRGTKGFSLFGQPAIADTSTTGMIRNGNFAIRGPDNTPLGWSLISGSVGTFNTDSGEPGEFGYSGGVNFDYVSGSPKLNQIVLSPEEVAKLKGQTIRATWVFKIPVGANLGSNQNRIGLWHQTSSGFTSGALINLSIFPEGEVVQYTASLEITDAIAANPNNIRATLQLVEGSVIVYGCSVTIGQASFLNFNKPVTDAGGVVYGPLDLRGELVLKTYADNAAAVAAGLELGRPYKTASGELRIVV